MKLAKSLTAVLLAALLLCTMGVSAFAYNDVSMDDEAMPSIEYVDRLGILPSTWNGDFNPDQYLTRAEAVIAAYRMIYGTNIDAEQYDGVDLAFVTSGETGDIAEESTLKAYLAWAVDNYLITTNVENSKFKPSEAITMNEFIALMAKIMGLITSAEASYPDDYVDAIGEIAGEFESGDAPVTRKQAAVMIANAIVADVREGSATPMQIGEYSDFDGNPTNSLAVKVFHMSSVDLVIRATKGKPLGYNVQNGTLLSNGADVDLNSDLTDYVGYGISVTYRDKDNSGTYTEDEEVLTYSIGSTVCVTISADNLSISAGNMMSAASDVGTFAITTSTYVYLNDNPWPLDDIKYDLTKLIAAIGKVANISSRSNLKFKCMAANAEAQSLITMFATEQKPGKIVGINKGYYSIFDYYYAGTENEIKVYYISDCVFSTPVKVGDYVNFYEAGGKIYCNEGSAIVSAVESFDENGVTLADGTTLQKHAFYSPGDVSIKAGEYHFVVDDSTSDLIINWAKVQNPDAYIRYKVIDIIADDDKRIYTVSVNNMKDNTNDTHEIKYDNVKTGNEIKPGSIIYRFDKETTLKNDGTEYLFIVDDAGANLLITWEAVRSGYRQLKIDTITSNDAASTHSITAKDVKNGEEVKFSVKYDNVDSTTPLAAGDFIDYSKVNGIGNSLEDFVKKTAPKTIDVAEVTDSYVSEVGTGKKYYFNSYYNDDGSGFSSGTATLMLDMAGTIVEIIHE